MRTVNVVVTVSIDVKIKRLIKNVDPRIKLIDVADLSRADYLGDPIAKEKLDVILAEAEIIYGLSTSHRFLTRAPKLKWVQSVSAGIDTFLIPEYLNRDIILTGTSGIHSAAIGEFILTTMLMFAKKAPHCFEMKQRKEWQEFTPGVLHGKTVGIIGLGDIGQEVARLSQAFGMKVIAIRRSIRTGHARNVDILYSSDQLQKLLSESDFIVLCLPLTPETNKLIGAKELRMMKPTAYIINISRGPIIDEPALIKALEKNKIAGAGLDVFAMEPLLQDNTLWTLTNVIYSPHIAGWMEDYAERSAAVFCANLKRYLEGKKMLNVFNKKRGY